MRGNKFIGILMFVLIGITVMATYAAAQTSPITVKSVEINNREVSKTGTTSVRGLDRGDILEVRVEIGVSNNLSAFFDSNLDIRGNDNPDVIREVEDVQIEAVIRGFDDDELIQDISEAFDAQEGVTYVEELNLRLPYRLDQDRYYLQIRVSGRQFTLTETYDIEIEARSHAVIIKDIVFSPERRVKAGRALLATVRVENVGNEDETDGIRVRVSVPELGISAADYIDELDEDESTTSEELYMRVPENARPGEYRVLIEATYDDGDETVQEETTITVLEGDRAGLPSAGSTGPGAGSVPRTIITIGPEAQDVSRDKGAIYPLTLTNQGGSAKTYTVSTEAVGSWARVKVSPSNTVVLQSGESKALFVFVSPEDSAPAGENVLTVSINSGGETLKQVVLKGNVVGGAEKTQASLGGIKKGLEIGLVVLVVLLVILGLVIGFNKLKGEEEGEEGAQTYY